MIVWLWDAPPRCGVSGSLEKAQEAAGTVLIAGSAPSARIEAARLALSTTLESAYVCTGQAWQARHAEGGAIRWEPSRSEPRVIYLFAERPSIVPGYSHATVPPSPCAGPPPGRDRRTPSRSRPVLVDPA